MGFISPARLELQLRRFENRISEYCGRHLKWAIPVGAAILVFVSLAIKHLVEKNIPLLPSGMFQIIRQARFTMPVLLFFSAFAIYFHGPWKFKFNAFVSIVTWAWSIYALFFRYAPLDVFMAIVFSLPVCMTLTFYIGRARRQRLPLHRLVAALLIYFGATWLYICLRFYDLQKYHLIIVFWRFKLQYMILVALQLAYAYSPRRVDPQLAFNPATLPRAILWPIHTILVRRHRGAISRLWWKGFFGVLLGYTVVYIKIILDEADFDQSRNIWVKSAARYVLVILADIGVLNIITGLARVFGHRVRDATNFSWLARTPAEYWRRGSVYHYEFINRYLYMRLWKRIKNRFIVTFISFFFFYIMKNGILDFGVIFLRILGFPAEDAFLSFEKRTYSISLFFIHFFLLFFSQRYWFFDWEDHESPWKAWASVFLTYGLQISAIALSIYINTHWETLLFSLTHIFV